MESSQTSLQTVKQLFFSSPCPVMCFAKACRSLFIIFLDAFLSSDDAWRLSKTGVPQSGEIEKIVSKMTASSSDGSIVFFLSAKEEQFQT